MVCEGVVLGRFLRSEAAQAHVLQMATLWNYGIDYRSRSDNKPYDLKIRLFFDILLIKVWKIIPRYEPKSSNVVRYQTVQPTIVKFWKDVEDANKDIN